MYESVKEKINVSIGRKDDGKHWSVGGDACKIIFRQQYLLYSINCSELRFFTGIPDVSLSIRILDNFSISTQAPSKETKPAPGKAAAAVKPPIPPIKKAAVPPRQKLPAKGAKVNSKGAGNKAFVKAMDITSVQQDMAETEASPAPAPKVSLF